MTNLEVRQAITRSRFKQFEIAEAMGMHESTLSRWFRKPLTERQQGEILAAINRLREANHETVTK